MTARCALNEYCPYKSDMGYCGNSGGCVKEFATVKIPSPPTYRITTVVDISTDSIEAIAEAVARKLREVERREDATG